MFDVQLQEITDFIPGHIVLQLSDIKKRFEANFLINIYSMDLFGIQKNVIYLKL